MVTQNSVRYQVGLSILAFLIILFTWLVAEGFYNNYKKVNSFMVTVKWANVDSVQVGNYPPWFFYSKETNTMTSHKVISEVEKNELLSLVEKTVNGYPNYKQAIDEVAAKSYSEGRNLSLLILILGGYSAVLGVQVRTLFDFVGRACYKKNLDIIVWWPWYILRPVLGFIVGAGVIILAKVKLINSGDLTDIETQIAIAAISGFGVVDAVERIRLVSKTVFGVNDNNNTTSPPS